MERAIDVARAIRPLIIETAKQAKNSEALKTTEARIYNHVTSAEYNRVGNNIGYEVPTKCSTDL